MRGCRRASGRFSTLCKPKPTEPVLRSSRGTTYFSVVPAHWRHYVPAYCDCRLTARQLLIRSAASYFCCPWASLDLDNLCSPEAHESASNSSHGKSDSAQDLRESPEIARAHPVDLLGAWIHKHAAGLCNRDNTWWQFGMPRDKCEGTSGGGMGGCARSALILHQSACWLSFPYRANLRDLCSSSSVSRLGSKAAAADTWSKENLVAMGHGIS